MPLVSAPVSSPAASARAMRPEWKARSAGSGRALRSVLCGLASCGLVLFGPALLNSAITPAAYAATSADAGAGTGAGQGAGQGAHAITDVDRLDDLIARLAAFEKANDPITAGREGDLAAASRLPDVTPQTDARLLSARQGFLAELDAIGRDGLPAERLLDYDILQWSLSATITLAGHDPDVMPFSNDSGFHTALVWLANNTTPRNEAEARAWIARMADLPRYFDENRANMERGITMGMTQPDVVVGRVIDQVSALSAPAPRQTVFWEPIARLPASIPPETRAALEAEAEAVIGDIVLPAYVRMGEWLSSTYRPAARPGLGIGSVPGGDAIYRDLAAYHTTTDMTPDEIHALGLSEVARIRGRMEAIIADLGFEGGFAAFQTFLRTDPQFYAPTPEQLIKEYAWIAKRADGKMPEYFATLPRLSYGVRDVPAALAPAYTTGRYWPGDPERGRAGFSVVNTYNLAARPLYELTALGLHEGVPGHHHQIALAQELKDVPEFRKSLFVTAFGEGWGLYTEYLGEEMGMYETPYDLFGRLSYEMWRACRLVADTGLHAKGWTLEQAEACFRENTALSESNIITEVERYIAWPGQALAYKIGELKIIELRRFAEAELGDAFDLRLFHDALLLQGSMPLSLLEARVRDWVAGQKAPPAP